MDIEINFYKSKQYSSQELVEIMKQSEEFLQTPITSNSLNNYLLNILNILKFIKYTHEMIKNRNLARQEKARLYKRPRKHLLIPIKEKLPLIAQIAKQSNYNQTDSGIYRNLYSKVKSMTDTLFIELSYLGT